MGRALRYFNLAMALSTGGPFCRKVYPNQRHRRAWRGVPDKCGRQSGRAHPSVLGRSAQLVLC